MSREELIRMTKRKLERANLKVDCFNGIVENLTNHGKWSLGYYQGMASALEDVLLLMEDDDV
jgi:hypothetical protein